MGSRKKICTYIFVVDEYLPTVLHIFMSSKIISYDLKLIWNLSILIIKVCRHFNKKENVKELLVFFTVKGVSNTLTSESWPSG